MSDTLDRLKAALASRYTVEREVGAGGMATVYLAQDVKHHRKVAVKVLRPEIAATLGAERFSREIEVAAQLQHPHILPLLDSGEADGFFYYVMPFVTGESLRDRLAHSGELPVHDAVRILTEVVDALAHAHASGVVHRDIKPDNIMLSGRHALVTDFGVAKAVSEATGAHTLTSIGVALGTPAYMAPEQAAADPHLDHRVDLYAVGVLGYELLTGRPPFAGLTPQETLAAHVTQAPEPVQKRRPGLSPALSGVLMKCLAKRPADRWQTAEELLVQLEPLATPSGGSTPTQSRPAVVPRRAPRWIWWGAGAAALVGAVFLVTVVSSRRGPLIVLGKRLAVAAGPELETWPSLSPDGKLVAYTRQRGTVLEEVVQQVEGGALVALTEHLLGAHGFGALSLDGERILLLSQEGLQSIPTLGGQLRLVTGGIGGVTGSGALSGGGGRGGGRTLWGTWSPDGHRIAYPDRDTLFTQALDGSARIAVATGRQIHSPAWSPGGEWIAYVEGNPGFHAGGNLAPCALRVVRAAGGQPVHVTEGGSLNISPVWVPGRRALLFISDREGGRDIYELYLTRSGAPAGAPVRITTGLNPERLATSADGRRMAFSAYTESANVWSLPIPARPWPRRRPTGSTRWRSSPRRCGPARRRGPARRLRRPPRSRSPCCPSSPWRPIPTTSISATGSPKRSSMRWCRCPACRCRPAARRSPSRGSQCRWLRWPCGSTCLPYSKAASARRGTGCASPRSWWTFEALDCFQKAIEADPGFAAAHAGLADAVSLLGLWGYVGSDVVKARAKPAAERALALDPELPDGHLAMGLYEMYHGWDIAAAESHLRRAAEARPRAGVDRAWLAQLLSASGRVDESMAFAGRALELEPYSAMVHMVTCGALLATGQTDLLLDVAERSLVLDEHYPAALWAKGWALTTTGEYPAAVAAFERAAELSKRAPLLLPSLAMAYHLEGNPEAVHLGLAGVTLAAAGRAVGSIHESRRTDRCPGEPAEGPARDQRAMKKLGC